MIIELFIITVCAITTTNELIINFVCYMYCIRLWNCASVIVVNKGHFTLLYFTLLYILPLCLLETECYVGRAHAEVVQVTEPSSNLPKIYRNKVEGRVESVCTILHVLLQQLVCGSRWTYQAPNAYGGSAVEIDRTINSCVVRGWQ